MNIVVCVKQVPDTWAERKLRPGDLVCRNINEKKVGQLRSRRRLHLAVRAVRH